MHIPHQEFAQHDCIAYRKRRHQSAPNRVYYGAGQPQGLYMVLKYMPHTYTAEKYCWRNPWLR